MKNRRIVPFLLAAAILCAASVFFSSCEIADTEKENEANMSASLINTANGDIIDFSELPELSSIKIENVKTTVDVTENGMVAGDVTAAEKNRKALNAIIRKAKKNTAIVFPEGEYYIASGRYSCVEINGKQDILICGNGNAKLIDASFDPAKAFETKKASCLFVEMHKCRNVTFEGITFDYLYHTTADGVITKTEGGYIYFDVFDEFISGNKMPLTGGEMPWRYNLFDENGTVGKETYINTDLGISLQKADGNDRSFRILDTAAYTEKKPGQGICLQFDSGTGNSHLFVVVNCKDITVRDCNVRSTLGITFLCSDNENLWFDRVTVAPEEESRAFFATTSDVVHATNNRGRIEMTGCRFEGLGDDALNVLGTMLDATGKPDGNTVPVKAALEWDRVRNWAKEGDVIRCFDSSYGRHGEYKVVKCSGSSLTLDGMPEGVGKGWFFQNISAAPAVHISDCNVSRGRARAFLIQTTQALIENCRVENMRLPAVLISPDIDSWHEVGFTDHVLIRNNDFSRCCLDVRNRDSLYGVIQITGCHDFNPLPDKSVESHGTIEIIGNRLSDSPMAYSVYARSVKELIYQENTISGNVHLPRWEGHPDFAVN